MGRDNVGVWYLNMDSGLWVLILILAVGIASGNRLLSGSAALLLTFHFTGLQTANHWLETSGVEAGILLLTVAVLAPFASGRMGTAELIDSLRGAPGISLVIAGAAAAYLTGRGVTLLHGNPQMVMGLALGSILGTAIFKGIPAGPLVAAGLAAVLINLWSP